MPRFDEGADWDRGGLEIAAPLAREFRGCRLDVADGACDDLRSAASSTHTLRQRIALSIQMIAINKQTMAPPAMIGDRRDRWNSSDTPEFPPGRLLSSSLWLPRSRDQELP